MSEGRIAAPVEHVLGIAFRLAPVGTADLIAITAALVALLAFVFTIWSTRNARRDSLRVEKSTAYLALEVASSDIFRYEAENFDRLAPYRDMFASPGDIKALTASDSENAIIAYNLYFQTLNLFEVCARFRRQEVIEHEVFASWVTWFYDTLDDWFFRNQWPDLRGNYTADVRDIFDLGLKIFSDMPVERHHVRGDAMDEARRREFFRQVATVMDCEEIEGWQQAIGLAATGVQQMPSRFALFGWPKRTIVTRSPISSRKPLPETHATSAMAKFRAG